MNHGYVKEMVAKTYEPSFSTLKGFTGFNIFYGVHLTYTSSSRVLKGLSTCVVLL